MRAALLLFTAAAAALAAEPGVTRADLGRALVRFERAWLDAGVEGEAVAGWNRRFDRATMTNLFDGGPAEMLRDLNAMTAELRGVSPEEVERLPAPFPGDAGAPPGLDEVRKANAARIAKLAPDTPELRQALASVRARNGLLRDRPSPQVSAEFLADRAALAGEVAAEIAAIEKGKNPYRGKLGDTWRVLDFRGNEIPFRLYAPKAAAEGKPLPLVVALHGAGGDENLFTFGYGAGMITRLAEEHGFLVASPQTVLFSIGTPKRGMPFDTLVETLSREYPVDRSRIYLLGHSLGAIVSGNLARGRSDRLAAACLMAGWLRSAEGVPPVLIVAGGLDPFGAKGMVEPFPEGTPNVTVRRYPRYGHTLVVTAAMPKAVEWLLAHRRKE